MGKTSWRIRAVGLLAVLGLSGCGTSLVSSPAMVEWQEPTMAITETPADQGNAVPSADEISQDSSLTELVDRALRANPVLQGLSEEVAAAWARVPQVEALPDPLSGVNFFGHPIETAAGSQRANLTLSQQFPWYGRLTAQGQKAALEAQALEAVLRANELLIASQVKTVYAQLYVLLQQIRINLANQKVLESLINVELARVRVAGKKTAANDTLRASLELSRLEEELVLLRQRLVSAQAKLNELLDRRPDAPLPMPGDQPADFDVQGVFGTVLATDSDHTLCATPVLFLLTGQESVEQSTETDSPERLPEPRPAVQPWTWNMLRVAADRNQPEILAARLQAEAARFGIRIAVLSRIPDLTLSVNWFFMDDNRPPSRVVDIGRDAWSVGAFINVPLWHEKYDALEREAVAVHAARIADVREVDRRYDALLKDLLEQARAQAETIRLYEKIILPQAEQTFRTDRRAYATGDVEFDRLMTDFRNLLNLEFQYHRARGELAIVLAQLERAIGVPLEQLPTTLTANSGDADDANTDPN